MRMEFNFKSLPHLIDSLEPLDNNSRYWGITNATFRNLVSGIIQSTSKADIDRECNKLWIALEKKFPLAKGTWRGNTTGKKLKYWKLGVSNAPSSLYLDKLTDTIALPLPKKKPLKRKAYRLKSSHLIPNSQANPKKSRPQDLPPLGSEEMKTYAKEQLRAVPDHIQHLLDHDFSKSLSDFSLPSPIFVTNGIRQALQQRGYAVIHKVFSETQISELLRYINILQESEGITENSYKDLSALHNTVQASTKQGWTKYEYDGPVQQIVSADANLYTILSELHGTDCFHVNFYEFKYNFGRPEQRTATDLVNFEFLHTDTNYKKLLFLDEAGVPVDSVFYQVIIPLTEMNETGATVYFAEGFNNHWKELTHRAITQGKWTQGGWHTCGPAKQFLPDDFHMYIEEKLTPVYAKPGDIIVFHPTLPHAPNLNGTSHTRVAAYTFHTPMLVSPSEQTGSAEESFLPNPPESVKNSILNGKSPDLAAHPYTFYKLPPLSKNFFPFLPRQTLPRSLLGDCLFGITPWSQFRNTKEYRALFCHDGETLETRLTTIQKMQEPIYSALRILNDSNSQLLLKHQKDCTEDLPCDLCKRLQEAPLHCWWHSTYAVTHKCPKQNKCNRCKEAAKLHWRSWKESGGCNCNACCQE